MCLDSQWLQVLQPENEEDRFRFKILPSTAVRLANALWFGLSGPIWNTEEWTAVDKINCATLGHVGDEATKKRWRSQRFPGKIYGSVWSHFNCAVNIKLCLNPVWQFNTLPLSQPGAGHQLTYDPQLQSLLWTVTDWIETPHRGAQCSKGSGGRSTGPPLKCTRNVFSKQVGVYIYIKHLEYRIRIREEPAKHRPPDMTAGLWGHMAWKKNAFALCALRETQETGPRYRKREEFLCMTGHWSVHWDSHICVTEKKNASVRSSTWIYWIYWKNEERTRNTWVRLTYLWLLSFSLTYTVYTYMYVFIYVCI